MSRVFDASLLIFPFDPSAPSLLHLRSSAPARGKGNFDCALCVWRNVDRVRYRPSLLVLLAKLLKMERAWSANDQLPFSDRVCQATAGPLETIDVLPVLEVFYSQRSGRTSQNRPMGQGQTAAFIAKGKGVCPATVLVSSIALHDDNTMHRVCIAPASAVSVVLYYNDDIVLRSLLLVPISIPSVGYIPPVFILFYYPSWCPGCEGSRRLGRPPKSINSVNTPASLGPVSAAVSRSLSSRLAAQESHLVTYTGDCLSSTDAGAARFSQPGGRSS